MKNFKFLSLFLLLSFNAYGKEFNNSQVDELIEKIPYNSCRDLTVADGMHFNLKAQSKHSITIRQDKVNPPYIKLSDTTSITSKLLNIDYMAFLNGKTIVRNKNGEAMTKEEISSAMVRTIDPNGHITFRKWETFNETEPEIPFSYNDNDDELGGFKFRLSRRPDINIIKTTLTELFNGTPFVLSSHNQLAFDIDVIEINPAEKEALDLLNRMGGEVTEDKLVTIYLYEVSAATEEDARKKVASILQDMKDDFDKVKRLLNKDNRIFIKVTGDSEYSICSEIK